MSKNYYDYNRHSNNYQNTNYKQNHASANPPVDVADSGDTIAENFVSDALPKHAPATAHGRVVDCQRLNVRSEANANASIVCELPIQSEVVITLDASTDDFYRVCTASGVEGFCMKKYIKI